MNVLITGAGGFVGRHIVAALLEAGHSVAALDQQFDADVLAAWRGRVELLAGDLTALPGRSIDVLIHGAAVTGSPAAMGQSAMQNFRANLDPALMAMDWATRHADRALFISSSAVFPRTAPGPVDEDMSAAPQGWYAVAKYSIERLVATYVAEEDRRWTVIRLSNLFGPGERARTTRPRLSLIGQWVHQGLTEGRITVPTDEPARDWTFVGDIGYAVLALLNLPTWSFPLYHVASEQCATPTEIARLLAALIPGLAFDYVGTLPDRPALTRLGYLSSARLREDGDFSAWTPLEQGLAETVHWQRAYLGRIPETM